MELSDAGLNATCEVTALDEYGDARSGFIAAERPLTIYLDKREIVTLMTMGCQPELLVLGWLRNQNLVKDIADLPDPVLGWNGAKSGLLGSSMLQAVLEFLG